MSSLPLLSLSLIFSIFSFIAHASVPPSATFKYVNEGEFGEYIVEYDANYRVLDPFAQPFQLCFYNTTPNAFTLALRMGTVRSESLMRWVWEANRGNPVRENATLTFGTDGNLVLADADGRIAWQTNTANKGVVGFKLLSNGNMVLHDSKGKFIWQSFDHPTDTLLVGQSLKLGAATKLVSRASEKQNVNGPYSLVLEEHTLAMYYKSPYSPNPFLYFSFSELFSVTDGPLESVKFESDFTLTFQGVKSASAGSLTLKRPKYNTTLSYLRLEIDGNLRIYTYEDNADYSAWENTYTLFDRDSWETECQLPERCGNFGLCEDNQCVACPSPKGLLGWSKDCKLPKVSSCGVKDFIYYKHEGVDHFMSKYNKGNGPMKHDTCRNKCTYDCKCLGYFYNMESLRCWIAYDLKTLTKVANSTHLAYIKAANK
ncbi:epidermis-specific secreted glycoprotein EP1 [Ricinus communis]|uniref:Epidermis-specific secreted glycoprotein EP1, putative n=1 Tax=Ricinus communis TaxID=3988 RepID=B9SI27_RICCO|nr:epidermis-specific secreted glycoprotein EP1 [Ricinus communis]EEF36764.1 Epidermis-specific secreted glycoprotein EP1 precursor, putative [Ricinus communis]|eukprot:XP_002525646.1 epidermis-specific secreted glycoprotein EP1 [Ricinus communis]